MDQDNIDDMFSQMLGELDDLTQQLNTVTLPSSENKTITNQQTSPSVQPDSNQVDEVADFDEEDINLTAILNDLSQIEEDINKSDFTNDSLEEDHSQKKKEQEISDVAKQNIPVVQKSPEIQLPSPVFDHKATPAPIQPETILPPPPPQESFTSATEVKTKDFTENQSTFTQAEREENIKSEKVRIAMEKLKEARVLKLVVKVFNKDGSSKTMMIDERMSTRTVLQQLIDKNHYDFSPSWSLIEDLPSLHLERMFEDHEKPCETMRHWTRDTTNQLRFIERKDKYALFRNPQHFLLPASEMREQMQEPQKLVLIEDFFTESGPSSCVPEVEGYLHIKNGKSWSRKYCVLRSSGLYLSKSGEPKKGKKLTDLVFLVTFDQNLLYVGRGWKKKFKAPFEYGFALKNPAIQAKSKQIRYIACEDFKSMLRWTIGIRLAKYGRQLSENYQKTNEEMKAHSSLPAMTFQPDSISLKSSDSGDTSSRSGTLSRPVDVKNVFEGAWQRASLKENTDKPSFERSTIPRSKASFKSSQKKGANWWDLQDSGQGSSESNFDESSSASFDDLNAGDRGIQSAYSDADLPLPPPPEDLPPPPEDLPPPPPSIDDIRKVHKKPLPPPLSSKPTHKTSSNDKLPPPPPEILPSYIQNAPDVDDNFKLPPPPPLLPKRTDSYSSVKSRDSNRFTSGVDLPPPYDGAVAPLSSYYIDGNPGSVLAVDDFPPPPPYVFDLKESFVAVTEPTDRERKQSIEQSPRPSKLIAYIKSQTLSRLQGNKTKAKKTPPVRPRSQQSRHSSKRR